VEAAFREAVDRFDARPPRLNSDDLADPRIGQKTARLFSIGRIRCGIERPCGPTRIAAVTAAASRKKYRGKKRRECALWRGE
jgi:hypothetical protein